jgi:hypothetical protein
MEATHSSETSVLKNLHCTTSQKMAFFIVTALKISYSTGNTLLLCTLLKHYSLSICSRQTSSQPDIQRREKKKLHRSLSLADVKELRNRKIEEKLDLATFLREASALVQSLSQATRLLEKGRKLNTTNSTPCAEQDGAIETLHNELWGSADNISYISQSPSIKAKGSYIGPSSLPLMMHSLKNGNGTTNVRTNITKYLRNRLRTSKECNMNMQTELDQLQHEKGTSHWLCDEHEMHYTSSLPDCSNLNKDDWNCYCSTSACPMNQPASHSNVSNGNYPYERSFSICSSPCSPRAYRQHLVAIRKQIIRASMPVMFANCK